LNLYQDVGKRIFDLVFSILMLVVSSPLMAIIALLVRIKMGAPVFFRQLRPGYRGKPFTLLKFRTMTDECDAEGNLLPDEERLTGLGMFLRNTSIDELPELINVLRGDMSFVGPRPLLVEYMDLYTEEQKRRHEVLPGITGWQQIKGRNITAWDERFIQDVWYVDNLSFWLDLKIVFITVFKVLTMQGATPSGGKVTSRFTGTNREN
jgi:lipopolysaccharide/colanic/teichoic acid biosynthesis glycosyltransferase